MFLPSTCASIGDPRSRSSFLASPVSIGLGGGHPAAPSPSKLRRTAASAIGNVGHAMSTQSPLRLKPMDFAFAPESPVPSSMPSRPAARLRFPDSVKHAFDSGFVDLNQCAADFSPADAGFWRSRSRRVAWGPSGELLAIDGQMVHFTSVFAPEPCREASVQEENLLNAALDTSVSDRGSSSGGLIKNRGDQTPAHLQCPRWAPQPGFEPLTQYLSELESQPECVLSRLLTLAKALWSPLEQPADLGAAPGSVEDEFLAAQLPRKEAFTEWVQRRPSTAAADAVEYGDESEGECANAIFRLLSAGQFTEACALALKKRHYRLALLLGQPHTESVRDLIAQQVACWQQTGAKDFIPASVWRLYRLLSGDVNGTEGMDWTRAFTLYLWFAVPYGDGLNSALRSYKAAFKQSTTNDSAPPPPSPLNPEHGGSRWDTAYHLVRLHCKRTHRLAKLLDPRGYGLDPIDYGPAWHLWRCLRAIGYSHLTESATQALHCGYAAKLESQGLWDWALFVLLHIDDDLARIRAVSGCLCRHLGTVRDPALRNFLTKQLGLPIEWLHTAWALACRSRAVNLSIDFSPETDSVEALRRREAKHWLAAGQWRPAHDILLNWLAPSWLVAGQLSRVRRSLAPIGRLAGDRQDWQLGGQLYLDFLKLLDQLDGAEKSQLDPEDAQANLASLCTRVAALPTSTVLQRVCQTELAQRCAHLLRVLLPDCPDRQAALLGQLSGLCCPLRCADCLLHGLLLTDRGQL